jgi:hypothetical protein
MEQKQLKKLERIWYKKLKKDGFHDIEYSPGTIKRGYSRSPQYLNQLSRTATEEYYGLASTFLNEYKFESEREAAIWEYHAEGLSTREIVTILRKANIISCTKSTVHNIVKRLESIMKSQYLQR